MNEMRICAPKQRTEATYPCHWIRGKLEEAEEQSDPDGGSMVEINLHSVDISDTATPTQLARHICPNSSSFQKLTFDSATCTLLHNSEDDSNLWLI